MRQLERDLDEARGKGAKITRETPTSGAHARGESGRGQDINSLRRAETHGGFGRSRPDLSAPPVVHGPSTLSDRHPANSGRNEPSALSAPKSSSRWPAAPGAHEPASIGRDVEKLRQSYVAAGGANAAMLELMSQVLIITLIFTLIIDVSIYLSR